MIKIHASHPTRGSASAEVDDQAEAEAWAALLAPGGTIELEPQTFHAPPATEVRKRKPKQAKSEKTEAKPPAREPAPKAPRARKEKPVPRAAGGNDITAAILDFIGEHPDSRLEQIASALGISSKEAKPMVAWLKNEGRILSAGAARGTTYRLRGASSIQTADTKTVDGTPAKAEGAVPSAS